MAAIVDDGDDRALARGRVGRRDARRGRHVAPGQQVTHVRVGPRGVIVAATEPGHLYHWVFDEDATAPDGRVAVATGAITALEFLIGGTSVVPGTRRGEVTSWFRAPMGDGGEAMVRAHDFEPQGSGGGGASRRRRATAASPRRRRRLARAAPPDLGADAGAPDGRGPRAAPGHRAQGRRRLRADGRRGRAARARQPASRGELADAVRQGLVRGVRRARVRLAVHGRRPTTSSRSSASCRWCSAPSRARSTRCCSRFRSPCWARSTRRSSSTRPSRRRSSRRSRSWPRCRAW